MKTRSILAATLVFVGSSFAATLAGGGPNFDRLTDADRKDMQERFTKEVWPLLIRGEKNGCVGCHNGKINGFMLRDDSGSLLAHIKSKDRKKRMPPPGKADPWTEAEMDVLQKFVVDLDKKQQKKSK